MKMKTNSLLIKTLFCDQDVATHAVIFTDHDHDVAMVVHRPRDNLSARGLEGAHLMFKMAENGTSTCALQIYD